MAGEDPDRFTSDPEELALIAVAWRDPNPVDTGDVNDGIPGVKHTRTRKALARLEERGHIARTPLDRGRVGFVLTPEGRRALDDWYAAHPQSARHYENDGWVPPEAP